MSIISLMYIANTIHVAHAPNKKRHLFHKTTVNNNHGSIPFPIGERNAAWKEEREGVLESSGIISNLLWDIDSIVQYMLHATRWQ